MNWRRNLRLSFAALARARSRAMMSACGMAIGICAVVMLLALGAGAEGAIQQAMESMGRNQISVGAQRMATNALRGASQRAESLSMDDASAIAEQVQGVERSAPIAMGGFEMRYRGNQMSATVIGTTMEFALTNNQILRAGRFLDEFDLLQRHRVAVIGAQVQRVLFKDEDALGKTLLVGGVPFQIIGILLAKGVDQTGSPQDDRILIPITTAQRRLLNENYVDRIFVQASSQEVMPEVMQSISELLRDRHGLSGSGREDDFTVRDQASLLSTMNQSNRTLSRFLTGIATFSLGLAGVGLLAVSLLSVRERQYEIGLRLAVGALPRQVLGQFLSEAVMIAVLGTAVGLITGILGIVLGQWWLGWTMAITPKGVLYPLVISLSLSFLFGVYPAGRAARLDPIAALSRS